MRKIFNVYLLLTILLLSFANCGGKGENPSTAFNEDDYYDFESLSLKEYDIPVTIMIPGETANIGASTQPEINHKPNHHKWRIDVGQNFHFEIDDWGNEKDMIAYTRKQLADNPMFIIKYLSEEENFIFFEKNLKVEGSKGASNTVGVDHKTYVAVAQYFVNGVTYLFRSKEEGDPKVLAEFVARTIKSVKPI